MGGLARRLSGITVLLALMLTASGCKGPPPPPEVFNEKLVEYNERLFTVGRTFRAALIPRFYPKENKDKQSFQVNLVRRAQSDAEAAVNDIRASFNDLRRPRNSISGKRLREVYEEFLVVQEAIAKEDMKKIVEILDDVEIKEADKDDQIRDIMKKIEEDEREVATNLANAHREFARDHNLAPGQSPSLARPPTEKK